MRLGAAVSELYSRDPEPRCAWLCSCGSCEPRLLHERKKREQFVSNCLGCFTEKTCYFVVTEGWQSG